MEWEMEEACELHCYIIVADLFTQRFTPCWVRGCEFQRLQRKRKEPPRPGSLSGLSGVCHRDQRRAGN